MGSRMMVADARGNSHVVVMMGLMAQRDSRNDRTAVVYLSALGGLVGSLCCVTPVVLVLLGLASVSVANDWGNLLYGDYKWWFRGAALVFLSAALVIHFRRRGVCSLDEISRQKTRVLNVTLLVLFAAVSVYVAFNYVVVHYWGIAAGLPWAQWDESWAIPVSAILLGVTVVWLVVWRIMERRRLS